jgi:hypothetical protein
LYRHASSLCTPKASSSPSVANDRSNRRGGFDRIPSYMVSGDQERTLSPACRISWKRLLMLAARETVHTDISPDRIHRRCDVDIAERSFGWELNPNRSIRNIGSEVFAGPRHKLPTFAENSGDSVHAGFRLFVKLRFSSAACGSPGNIDLCLYRRARCSGTDLFEPGGICGLCRLRMQTAVMQSIIPDATKSV